MSNYEISRRGFLAVAGTTAAAGLLSAYTNKITGSAVRATDLRVRQVEARRRRAGAAVRELELVAAPATVDLGGQLASTWIYGDSLPGREVRVKAGEVLRVRLVNRLPEPTSIHWHGLALRNDMDGVPEVTQPAVGPGETFTYEFVAPDPGTYWFHPHVGLQADRGLYAPLVVEDPDEDVADAADAEWTLVLDDWTDGIAETPDAILRRLERGMAGMGGSGGMQGSGGMGGSGTKMPMSRLLGGDAGDVRYPLYLINGRAPSDPTTFTAQPGQVARIRLVNAGSDTAFRVALGGHRLRITHTDGFPIVPYETDAVLLGMGERVDALVTLGDGAFPLVARAEGKDAKAFAVVRTASGAVPAPSAPELSRRVATVGDFRAARGSALPQRPVDRSHPVRLGGDMMRYRWTINGERFPKVTPLPVREGERVRLVFTNQTSMFHPMHLHGHTFQLEGDRPGARKDTLVVRPRERITAVFDADNPGQWMLHCHNIYHAEAGMMTRLSYRQ